MPPVLLGRQAGQSSLPVAERLAEGTGIGLDPERGGGPQDTQATGERVVHWKPIGGRSSVFSGGGEGVLRLGFRLRSHTFRMDEESLCRQVVGRPGIGRRSQGGDECRTAELREVDYWGVLLREASQVCPGAERGIFWVPAVCG